MTTPLKYTGSRRTAYEGLKIALRTKTINRTVYFKSIKKLNTQQRKADKRSAIAAQIRQAKEDAAEAAAVAAEVAREAAREARRIAKQKERNAKRKAARAAKKKGPVKGIVTFNYTWEQRMKRHNTSMPPYPIETLTKETALNYDEALGQTADSVIETFVEEFSQEKENDSPIEYFKMVGTEITSNIVPTAKAINKATIKMKDATALDLDGGEIQTWDTKNNTCVYDFIIWRYGEIKGCKKICNYERLDELFSLNGTNPRTEGVSALQLVPVCDQLKIRMYALDEKDSVIYTHTPMTINNSAPPLVFKIKDNHFYALCGRAMEISRIGKSKTDLEKVEGPTCKCAKGGKVPKELPVVVVENEIPFNFMIQQMQKVGKQVYPFKNVKVGPSGVQSFILDGKRYMFEDNDSVKVAIEIAKLNGVPYSGQTTYSILIDLLTELNYTAKSEYNPNAHRVISEPGIKYRTQYGLTDSSYTPHLMADMYNNGTGICSDIAKCYTSCLMEPMSEWLIYDFNDDWGPYAGTVVPGLYYVETADSTLLHFTNIYSHTIIQKAIDEDIPLTIKAQYLPTKAMLPKTYYDKLLQQIDTVCKGDRKLKKGLTNIITGFLGKHKTDKFVARLNTDTDVVWNDFMDEDYHTKNTFMYQADGFHLYGFVDKKELAENNIPQYIQVLDQSNIRLYDMIKASGGKCVWRKTDCAFIVGGSLTYPDEQSVKPGDYRDCIPPSKVTPAQTAETRDCIFDPFPEKFVEHSHITSSSQTKEVYDLLMETGGLANVSRAGTGKSYNVMEIEKKFMEMHPEGKVYKMAFTNKACLNIRGTTIHKFLKIDRSGKFKLNWLRTIKTPDLLIIIDEISMLSAYLWRVLVELKKALPTAKFILCGDYRQVPPVEIGKENFDYFNCSALKYLSGNNKIEFVERQRYDKALWDFAETLWNENTIGDFARITPSIEMISKSANICYYNNTRKRINARVNAHVAKGMTAKMEIPYENEEEEEKPLQQNVIIYEGLPVLSIMTHTQRDMPGESISEDAEPETVNNEKFIVTSFDDETIVCVSKRINDEGEEYDNEVEIATEDFHSRFILNYAATTHKSQGDTIDNNIIIWDFDNMTINLKYTAITRAKKLSQVFIAA